MRLVLYLFLYICISSGCAYHGDVKSYSRPFSATDLNTHGASFVSISLKTDGWWKKFNDPHLSQLIAIALADAPTMQIAAARVRAATQLTKSAVASLWPSLGFSGYVTRERFSTFGLVPPPFNGQIFNISDIGLNLNYELDFWGKNREMLAARISEECAARAELAEARLVLSAAVAHTYFQLLGNIAERKLARKYWQQGQKMADIVIERAKRGIESDIPVKTLLTRVDAAKMSMERYQAAETLSRNQLAVLLGKNPLVTHVSTASRPFHLYQTTLPTPFTANLLAHRPDIIAAKARAEAAAHAVHVAKAAFFPNINLNVLFSYQSVLLNQLFNVQSQNNSVTGAVDLPIFDAGLRRAHLGAKYAEYDMAVNQYNDTILHALGEVADQLATLSSLKTQLASHRHALRATSENYKLFRSRYNQGVIDYLPVLEINQLLIRQRAEAVNLQVKYLQAMVSMMKALGGQG